METRLVTAPASALDLRFDDRSLLETALGQNGWETPAPRTDCDCISYPTPLADEHAHSHQVTPAADQAH